VPAQQNHMLFAKLPYECKKTTACTEIRSVLSSMNQTVQVIQHVTCPTGICKPAFHRAHAEADEARRQCQLSNSLCCDPSASYSLQMAECSSKSCRFPVNCTMGGMCLFDENPQSQRGSITRCCSADSDCPPFPPPAFWNMSAATPSDILCRRARCVQAERVCRYTFLQDCCSGDSPDCDSYTLPAAQCSVGACMYNAHIASALRLNPFVLDHETAEQFTSNLSALYDIRGQSAATRLVALFGPSGGSATVTPLRCESRTRRDCECYDDSDCSILNTDCARGVCEVIDADLLQQQSDAASMRRCKAVATGSTLTPGKCCTGSSDGTNRAVNSSELWQQCAEGTNDPCLIPLSCDSQPTTFHGSTILRGGSQYFPRGEPLLPTFECRGVRRTGTATCCATNNDCAALALDNSCVLPTCSALEPGNAMSQRCELNPAGYSFMDDRFVLPCCFSTHDCYSEAGIAQLDKMNSELLSVTSTCFRYTCNTESHQCIARVQSLCPSLSENAEVSVDSVTLKAAAAAAAAPLDKSNPFSMHRLVCPSAIHASVPFVVSSSNFGVLGVMKSVIITLSAPFAPAPFNQNSFDAYWYSSITDSLLAVSELQLPGIEPDEPFAVSSVAHTGASAVFSFGDDGVRIGRTSLAFSLRITFDEVKMRNLPRGMQKIGSIGVSITWHDNSETRLSSEQRGTIANTTIGDPLCYITRPDYVPTPQTNRAAYLFYKAARDYFAPQDVGDFAIYESETPTFLREVDSLAVNRLFLSILSTSMQQQQSITSSPTLPPSPAEAAVIEGEDPEPSIAAVQRFSATTAAASECFGFTAPDTCSEKTCSWMESTCDMEKRYCSGGCAPDSPIQNDLCTSDAECEMRSCCGCQSSSSDNQTPLQCTPDTKSQLTSADFSQQGLIDFDSACFDDWFDPDDAVAGSGAACVTPPCHKTYASCALAGPYVGNFRGVDSMVPYSDSITDSILSLFMGCGQESECTTCKRDFKTQCATACSGADSILDISGVRPLRLTFPLTVSVGNIQSSLAFIPEFSAKCLPKNVVKYVLSVSYIAPTSTPAPQLECLALKIKDRSLRYYSIQPSTLEKTLKPRSSEIEEMDLELSYSEWRTTQEEVSWKHIYSGNNGGGAFMVFAVSCLPPHVSLEFDLVVETCMNAIEVDSEISFETKLTRISGECSLLLDRRDKCSGGMKYDYRQCQHTKIVNVSQSILGGCTHTCQLTPAVPPSSMRQQAFQRRSSEIFRQHDLTEQTATEIANGRISTISQETNRRFLGQIILTPLASFRYYIKSCVNFTHAPEPFLTQSRCDPENKGDVKTKCGANDTAAYIVEFRAMISRKTDYKNDVPLDGFVQIAIARYAATPNADMFCRKFPTPKMLVNDVPIGGTIVGDTACEKPQSTDNNVYKFGTNTDHTCLNFNDYNNLTYGNNLIFSVFLFDCAKIGSDVQYAATWKNRAVGTPSDTFADHMCLSASDQTTPFPQPFGNTPSFECITTMHETPLVGYVEPTVEQDCALFSNGVSNPEGLIDSSKDGAISATIIGFLLALVLVGIGVCICCGIKKGICCSRRKKGSVIDPSLYGGNYPGKPAQKTPATPAVSNGAPETSVAASASTAAPSETENGNMTVVAEYEENWLDGGMICCGCSALTGFGFFWFVPYLIFRCTRYCYRKSAAKKKRSRLQQLDRQSRQQQQQQQPPPPPDDDWTPEEKVADAAAPPLPTPTPTPPQQQQQQPSETSLSSTRLRGDSRRAAQKAAVQRQAARKAATEAATTTTTTTAPPQQQLPQQPAQYKLNVFRF